MERRKSKRIKVNIFVDEIFVEGETIEIKMVVEDAFFVLGEEALSGDISPGGVFIPLDIKVKENVPISLKFTLPNSSELHNAQGRIAWIGKDEKKGFGVEFKQIDSKTYEALQKLAEEI